MNDRAKWLIVAGVAVVALGTTALIGVSAWAQHQAVAAQPGAATRDSAEWASGARIVFRNTASGADYGHVASVPTSAPDGPRAVAGVACDRVDAADETFVCLRTERGIVPAYSATLYSDEQVALEEWSLSGIPSRTRISDNGERMATTAFVTGHSYGGVGFSTETRIRTQDGGDLGSLEEWALTVDGEPAVPVDRNFWGVTFAGGNTFYATAGLTLSGQTYLVEGDIAARTLTAIAPDVECPALSPDGTRIAFKSKTSGAGAMAHWAPAIIDLATGEVRVLPEARNVDDQIEWLDDGTILYGMPRQGRAGDYDVWALDADGSGEPRLLIPHAWSPSVVETGGAG
ncbi:TolB family protein [Microbacterium yannicii]|uniref:TolB family protein n=1 Tax=Microbacterium yannicii TaxID=671622 RepID=UPI0002F02031|nr:PD40 domain-containing protein [Microbacterium yannicii]